MAPATGGAAGGVNGIPLGGGTKLVGPREGGGVGNDGPVATGGAGGGKVNGGASGGETTREGGD